MERNPEFPAPTRHETLYHCTKPSGVPRGPSQLHSIPDLSEAWWEVPYVEGNEGFLPQPEKDLESPSSTRLEARFPYHDSKALTCSPRHVHGELTSLAPHERLPELSDVLCEKLHTGAAARENP